MLERIFPSHIDNNYKGGKIALYVFIVITFITIARSLVHIFASDGEAQSVASIPLDRFGFDAANTVVFVFALWGLSQLLMGFIYLVTIWKYRSLIPLMYIIL